MRDIGNAIELEDGGVTLMTEDDFELLLESAPDQTVSLNNYASVRVGDGMSTGERIR